MSGSGHWFLFILTISCNSVYSGTTGSGFHLRSMENFIQAVVQVEASNPGLPPLALVRALRRTAGHDDAMTIHFLGASNNISDIETLESAILNCSSFSFFDKAMYHTVTNQGEERGVVLAPDGTTVALAPLLLGLEAGLKAHMEGTAPAMGIVALTLARNLGLSFLSLQDFPAPNRLGPDGCWDNVTHPQVYKLSRPPSLATDALINGGMDGLILGSMISNLSDSEQPQNLSQILMGYYSYALQEGKGLDDISRPISPMRRQISRSILEPDTEKEVMGTLALVWKLEKTQWIALDDGVEKSVKAGVQQFVHKYWDCPPIIPRCQWGAEPLKETPIPVSLPLPFLFIHHTYEPASPCLSFPECSRGMRSMQRLHQDDRGWSDIGYSFVVGSDGYIYEGRGWKKMGAHTKGHNSIGYGVSIIGNYSSTLPSRYSMNLLRHRLTQCAVDGGRLAANFTIHGHRQMVNTSCPGDALYAEISRWEHFRETDSSKQKN